MNDMRSIRESVNVQPQLDIVGLAQVLGATEAAIRMRLYRNPQTLPPFYRIGRLFRWNPSAVQEWIESQTKAASDARVTATYAIPKTPQPIRQYSATIWLRTARQSG